MDNIKELRLQKGLTQEQLAKITGLSFVTINRAEKTGKMRLSTLHIDTLDYLLNFPPLPCPQLSFYL